MHIPNDRLLPRNLWILLVKYQAGFRCEWCGRKEILVSHHIDEDKENHRLFNGRCLCSGCHSLVHASGPRESALGRRIKRAEEAHTRLQKTYTSRKCASCGRTMTPSTRIHAQYCSGACRARASRDRAAVEWARGRLEPVELSEYLGEE